MIIKSEGSIKKFIKKIDQITYDPQFAVVKNQNVEIITERCVFELKKDVLELTEITSGINLNEHILSQIDFDIKVSKNLYINNIL